MKIAVAGACLVALTACSPAAEAPAPKTTTAEPVALTGDALVERGQYLVTAIGGCNDCHTPMTPQGPDMTKSLYGGELIFKPIIDMPWAPTAPALAGLPEGYTQERLAEFLEKGIKVNGEPAMPPMPQFRLHADDAMAVAAYIGSLPKPE